MIKVRDLGHLFLDPVEALTALVDRTLAVAHRHVFETGGQQQLYDRDGGCARAGSDDFDILFLLADDLQRVRQTREGDDGGAVLVIVEDGNVAHFLELALDFEAARGCDVLKVDAAKGAGNEGYGVHKLVDILGFDAKREGVDVAEGFKQDAFALHDGHAGFGADVAETEHGRAVGDDGAEVPAAGQLIAFAEVLLNFEAGLRDTGGVGEAQIVLRLDRNPRLDLKFALPLAMQAKRFFCVIHDLLLLFHCDRERRAAKRHG